jgi:hypothetical protein
LGGFIEILESKLDPAHAEEQLPSPQAYGAAISAIQPETLSVLPTMWSPAPKDPKARLAQIYYSVRRFAEFVPGAPLITSTVRYLTGMKQKSGASPSKYIMSLLSTPPTTT